ncbi:MAG: hemF [Chlamydiales bacterium]|jgi:coproporphyrinogen III oxidase|nr:hemF [Chlamydiales bacterium]
MPIDAKSSLKTQQERAIAYLKELREEIIGAFTKLDTASFTRKPWNYQKGSGGGEIALLKGSTFEKAAVNFSAIQGDSFPMGDGKGPFFATGVSLITHMQNPHAPTVHMNLRYIQTEEGAWFGGGYDLTPMGFKVEEDRVHFHQTAKEALDPFGEELYPSFAKQAKEYFYIPHRQKERGEGGLFFDHLDAADFDRHFPLWQAIGASFLPAIIPIYEKRISTPYASQDKEIQNSLRAHYVEFNLIYDRGTRFGFLSGGNPEAILCSMPPTATW